MFTKTKNEFCKIKRAFFILKLKNEIYRLSICVFGVCIKWVLLYSSICLCLVFALRFLLILSFLFLSFFIWLSTSKIVAEVRFDNNKQRVCFQKKLAKYFCCCSYWWYWVQRVFVFESIFISLFPKKNSISFFF